MSFERRFGEYLRPVLIYEGTTNPSFGTFPNPANRGIGWLTWKQLRKILEIARGQFRNQAERKFVEDFVIYLDYKIREAERIRNERKEGSFWKTMRYLIQQIAFTIFILKPFFLQDVIDLFLGYGQK